MERMFGRMGRGLRRGGRTECGGLPSASCQPVICNLVRSPLSRSIRGQNPPSGAPPPLACSACV
eukprot:10676759-Alexandrium_andersonii.AAC.1